MLIRDTTDPNSETLPSQEGSQETGMSLSLGFPAGGWGGLRTGAGVHQAIRPPLPDEARDLQPRPGPGDAGAAPEPHAGLLH